MKRITLAFVFFVMTLVWSYGQALTTDPEIPVANKPVKIIFDATQETGALKNFAGDLYAHTGVNYSDGTKWQEVIGNWGENGVQPKFSHKGNLVYELELSPDLYTFYNAPTSKTIIQIALVIRSSDKSKQTGDLVIDIYEEGLNISILNPGNGSAVIELNEAITLSAASSGADTLALFVNNSFVSGTDGSNLEYEFDASSYGETELVFWAENETEEIRDTAYVFVKPSPTIASLPEGVIDGINYLSDTEVILCLQAPYKQYVFAIGDFSDWLERGDYYMNRTPDGERWWVQITGLEPAKEYAFQYVVDGEIWIADPYTDKVLDANNDPWINDETYPDLKDYPEEANGIVSVFQTAQIPYNWQQTDFQAPDKGNLIVYELLLRDFLAAHDWRTLQDTLGYLKTLGINAIELMPFNEFEGNESWGYNPSFFFAPDKYYGPKDDLKAFIDACHAEGIAVIMDIVLNHAFGQCPLAMLYFDPTAGDWGQPSSENPWFNETSPNPDYHWGSDFNHEREATKAFVDRVNSYWMTEYKVDGFRFDFTKGFTNTYGDGWAYDAARIAILKRMADKIWEVNSDAYVILEHLADNSEEKVLSAYGMMLWGNMNHRYNELTMGYSSGSDINGVSYKSRGWTDPHLVGYMESHDEERLMFKNLTYGHKSGSYDIKDPEIALARMELAGALFFTIPGPKMIWQFGELGYDFSIDYEGRVSNKPIRWDYLTHPARLKLYKTWAALIHLKKTEPAFMTDDFQMAVSGYTKIITLKHSDMDVKVVGNTDVVAKDINLSFTKTGSWYDYFSGDELEVTNTSMTLNFRPGEYHIYTTKKLETPDVSNGISEQVYSDSELFLYPNPADNAFSIAGDLGIERVSIFNMNGSLKRVQELRSASDKVSVADYESGVYVIKLEAVGGESFFRKLVVE